MSHKGSFLRQAKRRPKVVNFDGAVAHRLAVQMNLWIAGTEEEVAETERVVRKWLMSGKTPDQILQRHREILASMPTDDDRGEA
jgi:hypothetical protein